MERRTHAWRVLYGADHFISHKDCGKLRYSGQKRRAGGGKVEQMIEVVRRVYGGRLVLALAVVMAVGAAVLAQSGTGRGARPVSAKPYTQWTAYGGGSHSSQYSALSQINKTNVSQLQVAWTYPVNGTVLFNPIVVDDVMYVQGTANAIVALDAATGKEIWSHPNMGGIGARGLNYWESPDRADRRLLYLNAGNLTAINAKTGETITSFGTSGRVDLRNALWRAARNPLQTSNPGRIFENVIIISLPAQGAGYDSTPADVQAYDVRTGKVLWTFHSIPHPGEFGYDTWPEGAFRTAGGVHNWSELTIDDERGIAFIPFGTARFDFYGGNRQGANLFANSLVALDARTGKRLWHHQLVHHDLWDFDLPQSPKLLTLRQNGRTQDVVAQATKHGYIFVFDRVTGKPVFPIEERPVPQSDVPGEKTSATQPHPPDKLRYARNFFNVPNDLIDFTPELRAAAIERTKQYRWATTPFNPPMLGNVSGLLGAITVGTATNWPGGGFDPETHILYAPSGNTPGVRSLVATPPGYSDLRYITGVAGRPVVEVWGPGDCCAADSGRRNRTELPTTRGATPAGGAPAAPAPPADEGGGGLNIQGIPIVKPPYGFLAAIDLDRGEVLFQAPHGDTPDNIRNHPALKGVNIPKTGQAGTSGVGLVITKTLVVMGDPQITTTPEHPRGAMLRAYDKKTGQQVGALLMPAIQSGTPMTYMVDGKQYIMVAVSGGNYSGEYIAYSLPN